jgi:hypothetical protein
MILPLSVGMVLGVVLGAVGLWSLLGNHRLRQRALSKVLQSCPDGWLIVQQGNRYRLRPVQHADGAITAYLDGDKHHWEGDDMMHELAGTPLGMAVAGPASVVDVEAAAAVDHVETEQDMPELEPADQLSVGQIRDKLQVGQVKTDQGVVSLINPFTTVDGRVTDLRGIVGAMRHAGTSDLPRKAAENAKLAERASKGTDLGQIGYVGSMFGAFLLGAITVEFIAGSGGGSVPNVGISLIPVIWP